MRRIPFLLVFAALPFAGVAAPIARPGTATAAPGDPKVYMAWHAPYGTPGALSRIPAACPDSIRRDTLYLSFELTQPESTFVGLGGEILVYAQPGDTLGSFWEMGKGGRNRGGLTAGLQHGEDMPGPSPWGSSATGNLGYERRPGSAQIKFGQVMAMDAGQKLEVGQRYVIGRLVLQSKGPGLTGCDQPVCLEWRRGEFVFGPGRDITVSFDDPSVVTRGAADVACKLGGLEWTPAPGAGRPTISVQVDTLRAGQR